ncbi:hypothetical protein GALL_538840 [mine drainage metagenome]|uniref:Uncharacterized protein n=1 Tax=mine drainage metagenome TaxID=410659 RepID=A0A1J5PH23_9ZZZZ
MRASDDGNDVAPLQAGVRQDRDIGRGCSSGDLSQENAARCRRLCDLDQRLSVHVLAGHIDVDTFRRHRQQFAIVDFFRCRANQVHQHVAPAGHRHDVAGLDHEIAGRFDYLAAPSDALQEYPLSGKQCLGCLHRPAHSLSSLPDTKRA